jgi:nucleotide-binding universal stress UspA family protein
MYDRILLALDGSDCAAAAADDALALAEQYGAELHAVCVVEAFGLSTIEERKAREREADERLEGLAERAADAGVDCETERRVGFADKELLAAVEESEVDLLVMGTHGRTGIQRFLLGSIAGQVVRHAPTPVFTTGAIDEPWRVERVLVATDGSENAEVAARHGVDIAARYGATVDVLSVVDTDAVAVDVRSERLVETLTERSQAAVDRVVALADERGVEANGTVTRGRPERAIVDAVEEGGADLVAMGTHGRSGVRRLVLGSVAEAVVRTSPSPVLTVPHRE